MAGRPTVLIVDDEIRSQEALRRTLEEEFEVFASGSAEQAVEVMTREMVQVILCDQRMPGVSGVEFLKQVREQWPEVVRIIISGYTDSEDIISSINDAGIYQFVLKPWQPDLLLATLRNAAELYAMQMQEQQLHLELRTAQPVLRRRVAAQRAAVQSANQFDRITRAPDSPLNDVIEMARKVAAYDIPMLITGESGSGKELVARAIHYGSSRGEASFVVENCGAVPDELLESELFGHKRGAFTGAYSEHIGLFQQADGGTIFLDEVGETSPAFQVKLLRVLQEGEVRAVGSTRSRRVDVRLISATNSDLEEDIQRGRFREDLYYRLSAVTIHVPPLRQRPMDIPPIARKLLEKAMSALGRRVEGFSDEALSCMRAYRWPGNVRELQNEVLRMLALCGGDVLGADLLSPRVLRAANHLESAAIDHMIRIDGSLKDRLEALEARVIKETLIRHRWNKSRAANELGLSRVGLRSKLARYGLEGE
jgi:two-component system response regulator HupR/HoxA